MTDEYPLKYEADEEEEEEEEEEYGNEMDQD